MGEQHNHHCLVTAGGYDWTIIEVAPGRLKLFRPGDEVLSFAVWIDITKVDWSAYCKAAVENDYARDRYAKKDAEAAHEECPDRARG